MESLLDLVITEALVFLGAWLLTFLLGPRLRRRHWMLSILLCGAIQAGGAVMATRLGLVPPAPWAWGAASLLTLAVIAGNEAWNALGHAAFSATLLLGLFYLTYVVGISAASHLGPLSLLFSVILVLLQAVSFLLLAASSWEILDVTCRLQWSRRRRPEPVADYFPRVSLHLPTYNEPPDMVIETLGALARLDYPNYEVLVIDNNTKDEALWRPVEECCRKLGFRFYHLDDWPGFKSGALNFALRETDPAADIVGVIDSDYVVRPDYLRCCVSFFKDAAVAFVQTPQDYRAVAENDRYSVACYDAYRYFFAVSMPSRNEHNGIIFAGTMGLIRREVLEALGGWNEWCITEDAEVSLRILDRGFEGVFIEDSFGHGLMPLNFEGLKKQRFRWAFGGMQILRLHWRALLPWRRKDGDHRLSFLQRWDYLVGALQWLNDPLTFFFTLLLLMGTLSLLIARSIFLPPLAPAVLFVPFLFIFIGVARFLWALRVRTGLTPSRAIRSFAILLGLTWVVTLACFLGLTRKQGAFLRTPKKRTAVDPLHAVRVVMDETVIAAICASCAVWLALQRIEAAHVWAMLGLLVWQTSIYASAPLCSWWGLESERLSLPRRYPESWRTTGVRIGAMVRQDRVALAALAVVLVFVGLFATAVRLAPEMERLFRAPSLSPPGIAPALTAAPDPVQVRAVVFAEERAALQHDVARAMSLWSPQGIIRDVRGTPQDTTDDLVWAGLEQIRRRYQREFSERRYLQLAHEHASVVVEGDRASVVNDLRADIESATGRQQVYLSRSDRWILRKERRGWRISELVVNRAPR